MKKSSRPKKPSRFALTPHLGLPLLLCFTVASIAVTLAMRQMILEKRYRAESQKQDSVSPVIGDYQVTLPVAKGTPKTLTLTLRPDRSASLLLSPAATNDYAQGSWSGDTNGTVIVTFPNKTFAFTFNPADSGSLRILNPDVDIWGAATLTLKRSTP